MKSSELLLGYNSYFPERHQHHQPQSDVAVRDRGEQAEL
jgi:hypothetical protein